MPSGSRSSAIFSVVRTCRFYIVVLEQILRLASFCFAGCIFHHSVDTAYEYKRRIKARKKDPFNPYELEMLCRAGAKVRESCRKAEHSLCFVGQLRRIGVLPICPLNLRMLHNFRLESCREREQKFAGARVVKQNVVMLIGTRRTVPTCAN